MYIQEPFDNPMSIFLACLILASWAGHLWYSLTYAAADPLSPWSWLHAVVQAYLFTGLFITAHDAMHGTVSRRASVNTAIGMVCCFLFAGLSYKRLLRNHRLHHAHPGEERDPDFSTRWQDPFRWWGTFLFRYTTITQLAIMAIGYNLLMLRFDQSAIWMYWVGPAFLGTFQLFFFGTYLPHRRPHTDAMRPHNARTQRRNHLVAMLTCYFFGYHYEHHESPGTPWWRLARYKDAHSGNR
jgi:beta-carotene/zeaxanthin 4-ketolase